MRVELWVESDERKSEYIFVKATGEFSLERAKQTFLEVLKAVAENQIYLVLFDGREITGSLKVTERFYYSTFVAEATIRLAKNAPRFAYVLREPILDPKKFGEVVAVNRGMFVRSFADFDEAINWLTQPIRA